MPCLHYLYSPKVFQGFFMVNENNITLTVPEEYAGTRIDVFIYNALEEELSRSFIQKLLKNNHITVDGMPVKPNYKVKSDQQIHIIIPQPEKSTIEPEDIPLHILYEDNDIAIIHKPAGMVVHPGAGNSQHTLVNALLYHFKGLSSIGGVERPGIVHRLDKDTEGIMVIAKNDTAHNVLTKSFQSRNVIKKYEAIVTGKPSTPTDTINKAIERHPKYGHKMTVRDDGKEAITHYTLREVWHTPQGVFSHLSIQIFTGRTHQIRVHLSSIGLPIVGDKLYSKKWEKYNVPFMMLASTYLAFEHPVTGKHLQFSIDLPQHMKDFIKKINTMAFEHIKTEYYD
ncbi:MAG TPA: RluA family pseudouridine synthase [Spirochaetota bacterium]|mgnify:CR=1 FL=1|nr:RluA family pseudouridine synthase [Spirochaetota bacterium]